MPKKPSIQMSVRAQTQVSPQILQQTQIAAMSQLELEHYLWEMVEKNPFFHFRRKSFQSPLFPSLEMEYQDHLGGAIQPENILEEMQEELLVMGLSPAQKWIGDVLLTSLLPDGSMSVSLESVAAYTGVDLQEVQVVFQKLAVVFPHIRELSADPIKQLLSRLFSNEVDLNLALDYWQALQKWSVKTEQLTHLELRHQARQEVLKNQDETKASILDTIDRALEDLLLAGDLFSHSENDQPLVLKPDFLVTKEKDILRIEKPGELLFSLSTKKPKDSEEKVLWKQAKDLVGILQRQESFFLELAYFLVKLQKKFFEGARDLVVFHQKELASHFHTHPSTISRVLKKRYFLFEGKMLPLKVLVQKPLKTKTGEVFSPDFLVDQIRDILTYTQGYTVSDEKIRQMLTQRNIHIARKTVNKYRKIAQAPVDE